MVSDSHKSGIALLLGSASLAVAGIGLLVARFLPQASFTYRDGRIVEILEMGAPAWYLVSLVLLGTALLVVAIAVAVTRRLLASVTALALSIVAIVVVAVAVVKLTATVEENAAAGLVLAGVSALAAVLASTWCLLKSVPGSTSRAGHQP